MIEREVSMMFAIKQKFGAAIPVDPPSQCLQDPLLEKSNSKKYMHQHEKAEEDPSLAVVGSPVLANIQLYSFLLGLMIMAFFIASFVFEAHVLTLAMFGDNAVPGMVTLFSVMWSFSTSAITTLGFFYALGRLNYSLSGDTSAENETIIIRDISCRFGLGTLIGFCSAWVLVDLLLGLDRRIKYSAGVLVGVTMLSLIFQFCSGNKHRQVTLFGSLVETNKFAPLSSWANKHGIIDPAEMGCGEVHSDNLVLIM
jgi:hypothetical protein